MKSHEVLRESFKQVGVKSLASDMRLSPSLLYKWCEEKDGPDSAGADNPLDRLQKLINLTNNTSAVDWLCQQNGGYFVHNPETSDLPEPLISFTRKILQEFTDVLNEVSRSIENDGVVCEREAKLIRKEWEDLKRLAESFVAHCEHGTYSGED